MSNPHKGRTGLDRVWHAARYSADGLGFAYRNESAFRQELWLALLLSPAAFWLGQDWLQTAVLLASLLAVLIVELLNSAIESVVDRVSFELHALSKNAKDLASAAVMLSLLLCAGLWLTALWQRLSG